MKVNFSKILKDYRGEDTYRSIEVVKDGKKAVELHPQLIKDLVCQALYSCGDGLTSGEKYLAYKLNLRLIQSSEEVDISTDECVLIKKVCDNYLTSGSYGQVVDLIEGGM